MWPFPSWSLRLDKGSMWVLPPVTATNGVTLQSRKYNTPQPTQESYAFQNIPKFCGGGFMYLQIYDHLLTTERVFQLKENTNKQIQCRSKWKWFISATEVNRNVSAVTYWWYILSFGRFLWLEMNFCMSLQLANYRKKKLRLATILPQREITIKK